MVRSSNIRKITIFVGFYCLAFKLQRQKLQLTENTLKKEIVEIQIVAVHLEFTYNDF